MFNIKRLGSKVLDFWQYFSNFLAFQSVTFQHFTSTVGTAGLKITKYRRHTDPNGGYDQNEIKRNKALNYFKQNCPIFAIQTFLSPWGRFPNNFEKKVCYISGKCKLINHKISRPAYSYKIGCRFFNFFKYGEKNLRFRKYPDTRVDMHAGPYCFFF